MRPIGRRRETVTLELRPRRAAVGRLIDSVFGAAAGEASTAGAETSRCRRRRRLGSCALIARSEAPLSGPTKSVCFQVLSAVVGDVDAAIRAIAEDVAERPDDHVIVVARVDENARDVPRAFQADVRPRVAAVGGLIDAVAVADVVTRVRFAGSDPHRLVVGRIDRHRTDRADACFSKTGIPRLTASSPTSRRRRRLRRGSRVSGRSPSRRPTATRPPAVAGPIERQRMLPEGRPRARRRRRRRRRHRPAGRRWRSRRIGDAVGSPVPTTRETRAS